MRYYKTSKKSKIQYYLKTTVALSAVTLLFICSIRTFDTEIINSAFWFVDGKNRIENSKSEEYLQLQNFDEDFTTFLNKENTEIEISTLATATDNSEAIPVNLSALSGKYTKYDGTAVLNNTKYDVSDLLYEDYKLPELNKTEPYILIYHTHTSEEYYGGGTVVDVGNTMTEEFEKLGYQTIHLTTVYDKEQFSGAYSRSVVGAQEILKKYPSIKLVFDVHRDAITTESGDTYRPVTTINGEKCAQIMFVCGTDAKGLEHPNWKENFKFALDISRTAGKTFGELSRPVNLRGDRFNTHLTKHTLLIEMGSAANTLEEAKIAAKYTAQSIIKTIEK